MTQVVVAGALVLVAIALSRAGALGLERELAVSAVRAAVQLAAVGAIVTFVFAHAGLAAAFVAVMLGTATVTSGRRLRGVPDAWWRAGVAIAAGAATGIAPMLLTGAFSTEPRELIPVAGILIGGAMVATSVTGRRLAEHVGEDLAAIETRLALGVPVRTALAHAVRAAATTGLIPLLDQTKNVGLVTLPGTFVGLVLVCEWVKEQGGLEGMYQKNVEKAQKIYDAIDATDFYRGHASADARSIMNVTFRLPSEDLEKKFAAEATAAGLDGLKGHRSVGGIRASIYNAFPPAGCDALAQFMREFERTNG